MMKPEWGVFITLEGIDGVGKTTQLEFLQSWLERQGRAPLVTREPGGTQVGERIRQLLLEETEEMNPVTEALLYAAARAQLVDQVLRPALERGQMVLCDRFLDSSIAYQGFGRGLGQQQVEEFNRPGVGGLRPDLTLYLDLPAPKALRRKHARGRVRDRMEGEEAEFFQRVRRGYLALARQDPERFRVVPATGPAEAVWSRLQQELDRLLGGRG